MLAAYTGVFMAVVVAEVLLAKSFPNSAFLGGQIALGMMSNGQLLQAAHGRYLKLKAAGLSEAQANETMHNGAAGSVGLAFLDAFLCFAFIASSAIITEFAVNGGWNVPAGVEVQSGFIDRSGGANPKTDENIFVSVTFYLSFNQCSRIGDRQRCGRSLQVGRVQRKQARQEARRYHRKLV